MDLLDRVGQKGRNKNSPDRMGLFQPQRGKAATLLLAWLSASLRSSRSTYVAPVSVHGVYAGHVIGLCGSPLWRANDWAGEKFANGFANEPRSTAWHGASLARIVTRKMANKSTRLTTERHAPARESWNSKAVVRLSAPRVRISLSPPNCSRIIRAAPALFRVGCCVPAWTLGQALTSN